MLSVSPATAIANVIFVATTATIVTTVAAAIAIAISATKASLPPLFLPQPFLVDC
jgi:hypothetical protein